MDERYDPEALGLARQAATPGERVLWAGRPRKHVWLDWPVMVPAVASLAALAGGWWGFRGELDRLIERPWLAAVVLVMLLTIPVGKITLALLDARRASREIYAVTNRRVMILAPDGAVRHDVDVREADGFRVQGRTLWLGGEEEAMRLGKTDMDGGLSRFENRPRLRRLADPEQVMTLIRSAAGT